MKDEMYKSLAKYYDLIYSKKDYKKESQRIKDLIKKNKKSKGKELLEVACGTGNHLKYLKKDFKCTGIDLNQEMLNIAKKKVKGPKFKKANMTNFQINKKFDVLICLFSSIGYTKTYPNLIKTINNFSKHLKEGGVVIIEPWITKSNYRKGDVHMENYRDKNLKIARVHLSKIKGNLSLLDMHYLIAEKGKDVKHVLDKQELGLFDNSKILKIMKNSGLDTKYLKKGFIKHRGLFVGVKK